MQPSRLAPILAGGLLAALLLPPAVVRRRGRSTPRPAHHALRRRSAWLRPVTR